MTGDGSGASSLDGRAFSFRLDAGTPPTAGDLVVLTPDEGPAYLGQTLESSAAGTASTGAGSVIGAIIVVVVVGMVTGRSRAGRGSI